MATTSIRIEGIEAVMARLRVDAIARQHLRDGFNAIGFLLTNEAKQRAPVDTGLLRNSIAFEVDPSPVPLWVTIGARPHYAPYMEYGTGLCHDHPSWPKRPHKVPLGALDKWGHRTGNDGNAVALMITLRGGLKPRRYLRGALEANGERVIRIMAGALRKAGET